MSAVLNTNTASLLAAKNLLGAQNRLAASVERLSSGLRINRSRDDAAGLGVANSLTAQINGANQGMRNLNDAISMVQTGEGAISGASDMGQRILMLATQGANGTLGVAERRAIQTEMVELLSSIDSIGARTKFSGNPLLHVGRNQDSSYTAYSMQISNTSTDAINLKNPAFYNIGFTNAAYAENGRWSFGTETITTAGTAGTRVFVLTVGGATRTVTLTGATTGADRQFTGAQIASAFATGASGVTGIGVADGGTGTFTNNASVSVINSTGILVTGSATGNQTDFTLTRAGTAVVSDEYNQGAAADTSGQASDLRSLVVTLGTRLTDSETGGETDPERLAVTNAFKDVQDAANTYVIRLGSQRSLLGAYQNQMEYTLANITELSSNLSSARSRVIDTDYASETAMLTRGQILQQAATAMLAQANQMPNVILTLLK